MTLPGLIKTFIFSYIPMIGIIIAFEDYNAKTMFFSPWNNFNNFKYFFNSIDFKRLMVNTIVMNLLFVAVGTIFALILALILFEVSKSVVSKMAQVCYFVPFFVSYVVVSVIVNGLLNGNGLITNFIYKLTGNSIRFYMEPKYWKGILLTVHVWKTAGVTAVIYYTTLLNVEASLYEAAAIDGASHFRRVFTISIPQLRSMIVVMVIMSFANLLHSDFNLFFYVTGNSSALYSSIDVIDTYVYRAIKETNNFGLASAVSFIQSVAGFILTIVVNKIAKKIDNQASMF